MAHPNDCQATTELYRHELEGLGHICAIFNKRVYRASAQEYKYDPLYTYGFAIPPEPSTVSPPSALSSHRYVHTDTRWLRLNLQQKIEMLQTKNIFQLKRRIVYFKRHYDGKVHI